MAFCPSCGSQVEATAKFCSECGSPLGITANETGGERRDAKRIKCPECGEPIPAFSEHCPLCGYELRGSSAPTSVVELSKRLDEIERSRPRKEKKKKRLFNHEAMDLPSATDQRKATLIQNFPIPNDKESLIEFLVLSAANVDPHCFNGEHQDGSRTVVNTAWYAKMNQAYAKAELVLKDDPALGFVKKKYEAVEKRIKRSKWSTRAINAAIVIAFFAVMAGLFAYEIYSGQQEKAYRASLTPAEQVEYDINEEEEDCKEDESSIKYNIEQGYYSKARDEIATLEFDEELSEARHKHWQKRKKELYKMVDEAEANGK